MKKTELAKAIAEHHDITAIKATQILEQIESIAAAQLIVEKEFTLPGIGKLKTKTSAARIGRNPKTGESISIPAKTVVKFAVAKALKDAVA